MLCIDSQKIPFSTNPLPYGKNTGLRDTKFALGTYKQMKKRTGCSSCQIVISSLLDLPPAGSMLVPKDDERLYLAWQPSSDFPGHFVVYDSKLPILPLCTAILLVSESDSRAGGVEARVVKGSSVDVSKIQKRVTSCTTHHSDVCVPLSSRNNGTLIPESGLPLLRVVDVINPCIVKTSLSCRYIALSYVWGNATQ